MEPLTAAEEAAVDVLTLMRRVRRHRVLCACLPCAEAKATLGELEDGEIDRLVGEASAERVAWLVGLYAPR